MVKFKGWSNSWWSVILFGLAEPSSCCCLLRVEVSCLHLTDLTLLKFNSTLALIYLNKSSPASRRAELSAAFFHVGDVAEFLMIAFKSRNYVNISSKTDLASLSNEPDNIWRRHAVFCNFPCDFAQGSDVFTASHNWGQLIQARWEINK